MGLLVKSHGDNGGMGSMDSQGCTVIEVLEWEDATIYALCLQLKWSSRFMVRLRRGFDAAEVVGCLSC